MKFKLKRFLTAAVSVMLVFSMLSGLCVFAAEEETAPVGVNGETPWDADYPHETNIMQFHPSEGYVSEQNPPNFTWGFVDGATYELAIATDRNLENIVYTKSDIIYNYCNLETTLETGVHYYWAVRYKLGNTLSTWSTPRKFRIQPDAYEFVLPPIDEVMARVPSTHPRIYTTPDNLEEFRSFKDKTEGSKATYDYFMNKAQELTDIGFIQEEPEYETFDTLVEQSEWHSANASKMNTNSDNALTCGYAYLLSGNTEFADYAIECLMEAASWDYVDGPTSYAKQDQWHRSIAYKSAMAYDWLYPEMTESERQTVLDMIRGRTQVMAYLLDTLGSSPYDSHGWTAYGYIGIIAIATYGEIPEAADWLEQVILGYAAILPPWSYQDGGWSQGTDYWQYSTCASHEFLRCLASAGILNLYEEAWQQNQYLFSLYAFPPGSYGTFGDASFLVLSQNIYSAETLGHDAYFTKNPVTQWLLERFGGYGPSQNFSYVINSEKREAKAPTTYQLSHEFSDIGWVIMMDDLINQDRIQFSFKSSPYGSFNHSHADQNSFVLQAYGERLAIKSGYYDAYHSNHDSGFTRTTPAHNSVTVATSKGQKDDDFSAKGHLTGYLTQVDFDLAKGDATEAYKGNLGKFERSVIYVRPDMFIIIDDLKASDTYGSSKFEWWLNAEHAIEVYEDGTGARITENEAMLDAKVVYPQKVTTYYNDMFASSNMKEYLPEGNYASRNVQTRVWFETESVPETKMIVALDVHRAENEARYIDTKYFDNYVKMTLEDGTVIYVNLGESNEEVVTEDGITFTGECVVYNDRSIMLSGGTSLKQGDTELISLAEKGSVVMGADEISISTYVDNQISINTANDYMSAIESVTDYDGNPIGAEWGITMEDGKLTKTVNEETGEETVSIEPAENYVTFNAEMDNYQLMLNGKLIADSDVTTTATISIDGVEETVTLNGYINRAGEPVYQGTYDFGGKKLICVEKSDDFAVGGYSAGVTRASGEVSLSATSEEGNYIKFETVPTVNLNTTVSEDYDAVKDQTTIFVEAEDYDGEIASGAATYATRSFLSGGVGMQLFNTPGTTMTYQIEVPEEGDYDFVVKYVAWEDGGATRSFAINGVDYVYTMEQTTDWGTLPENWRVATTDSSIHLTPGTYTLTMDVVSGVWNYDWFGFIKK